MSTLSILARPNAVVQGKVDRARSNYEKLLEYPLKSSNNYTQEGDVMVWTSESGVDVQVVDRSAGSANEFFAGVAYSDYRRITDFVNVQSGTVPSAGTYTFQLARTVPTSGSFYLVDSTGTAYSDVSPSTPASATQYKVSSAGLVTFHSGAAGKTFTIRYTYTPDANELNSRFHQVAHVQQAQSLLAQVAIAVGYCEIYTTQYVTSDAWALQDKVYTGASGKFTKTTTAVMVAGRVISLPTVNDPYLGVAYQTGTAFAWA